MTDAPQHLKHLPDYIEQITEVMYERGRKYGPGNIAEFGELGIIVRLSDKMARLKQSLDKDFADESVEDTYVDIANYALIALMVRNGHWQGVVPKFPEFPPFG